MGFRDQIAQVEVIGAETLSTDLPRFHWYHGMRGGVAPAGHFFVKASAIGNAPSAPWVEFTNQFNEPGYKAESLKIAVLGKREQWFIPGENEDDKPTYITGYQEGAKSNIELLCFVEGFGTDPLVLSASGKFKAGALKAVVKQYETLLLKPAMTAAGKALHSWTFWIPITAERDGKGQPVYEVTKGKNGSKGALVTPPILALPQNAMDELYVGNDLLKTGEAIRDAYKAWANERRLPVGVIEGEVLPQLPAPSESRFPPRNVPQPINVDNEPPF